MHLGLQCVQRWRRHDLRHASCYDILGTVDDQYRTKRVLENFQASQQASTKEASRGVLAHGLFTGRARGRAGSLACVLYFFPASSPVSRTARKAFWGMSTLPIDFMRFLPAFCFSQSLRLRLMSPP